MTDSLHMRDVGEGPVVLLLHAFPCDGRMWQPQADALVASGWRVLTPDLPGFGKSALLSAEPSVDAVARALHSWLDDRGIAEYALGGVSLGGYLAMAMLRARPGAVSALMLCDTKATADTEAARENRERLARTCLESPVETGRILEAAVLPGLLGDTTRARRPEVVALVRGWLHDASAAAVAWYQRAMAGRPDSLGLLSGLEAPVLILSGDEDALSPGAEQDLMHQAMPHAHRVEVAGAGHLANVELPERVAAEMQAFLAGSGIDRTGGHEGRTGQ